MIDSLESENKESIIMDIGVVAGGGQGAAPSPVTKFRGGALKSKGGR